MTVISIQSQVVHGHVGNSATVFPLRPAASKSRRSQQLF